MFQSVKANSQIYVLHKDNNPRIEIGTVIGNPIIRPKYKVPQSFTQNQEMVVDIVVSVGGENLKYTDIPALFDISDSYSNGENIIISDNKEAMNAKLLELKQSSQDILNSIDHHKLFVTSCDRLLSELNPELAERQAQRAEIDDLKQRMDNMVEKISILMNSNRQLIEQLSNKEKSE